MPKAARDDHGECGLPWADVYAGRGLEDAVVPPSRKGVKKDNGRDRVVYSCLKCYFQKKKCDRAKPVCGACAAGGGCQESCRWDPRLASSYTRFNRPRRRSVLTEGLSRASTEDTSEGSAEEGGSPRPGAPDQRSLQLLMGTFNGLNRTWFNFALSRYSTICRLYTKPARTPDQFCGLYDLWKYYLSTSDVTFTFRTDTPGERQALYNTFHGLAAFAHSCAHANLNMVSHAKHIVNITTLVAREVFESIAKHGDALTSETALSTMFLYKALHPLLVSPSNAEIARGVFASMQPLLRLQSKETLPEVSALQVISLFFQGRPLDALQYNLAVRREELACAAAVSSPTRVRALMIDSAIPIYLVASVCNKYNASEQEVDFSSLTYDGLTPELQLMWDDHCAMFRETIGHAMGMTARFESGEENDAMQMLVDNMCLDMCYCLYWKGDRSPWLVEAIEERMMSLLSRGEDHPFNHPYKDPILAGGKVLSEMAPLTLRRILAVTGVMDERCADRLSIKGRAIRARFEDFLRRAAVPDPCAGGMSPGAPVVLLGAAPAEGVAPAVPLEAMGPGLPILGVPADPEIPLNISTSYPM